MTFPTTSHYPPQYSGPCNSFNCLGHFKNVCDYDYDDDDDTPTISRRSSRRCRCRRRGMRPLVPCSTRKEGDGTVDCLLSCRTVCGQPRPTYNAATGVPSCIKGVSGIFVVVPGKMRVFRPILTYFIFSSNVSNIWEIFRTLQLCSMSFRPTPGHTFHYDLRKHFLQHVLLILRNSLPNSVVDANSVNAFKARLDKFWMHQEVMFTKFLETGYLHS